jgi:phosphohistidine phosphatase
MQIYLVQHAEATSEQVDPERPLTEQGREDIRNVAALAAKLGVQVTQIRHSGKLRAEQTASVLGEALAPPNGVASAPGLGPVDDVEPVARGLDASPQPLMLVGHLPFMERLTGQMTAGDADLPVVTFHNAAIVCLVKGDERWQVSWILTPEMAAQ